LRAAAWILITRSLGPDLGSGTVSSESLEGSELDSSCRDGLKADSRVIDFAWLALRFVNCDCARHDVIQREM
jgi:hypothetical protein